MNEWTNEWMNEWMNEWTNERMNEWTNERMNERMNEWTNEWMNEWTNERNERMNECTQHCLHTALHVFNHTCHAEPRTYRACWSGRAFMWGLGCTSTMMLDSLLITFSFQLAAHQQKTEQNVLLIWTLSHITGIQTNACVRLIALTRLQTKSTWLLEKLLSNQYDTRQQCMMGGWFIKPSFARTWRSQTVSAVPH